eukprot:4622852-Amphidinium_carterae.1
MRGWLRQRLLCERSRTAVAIKEQISSEVQEKTSCCWDFFAPTHNASDELCGERKNQAHASK